MSEESSVILRKRKEKLKMFRKGYHKCFVCERYFDPLEARICPKCDWMVCTHCGSCACKLSEEARRAIEALFDTFCSGYCQWRLKG